MRERERREREERVREGKMHESERVREKGEGIEREKETEIKK